MLAHFSIGDSIWLCACASPLSGRRAEVDKARICAVMPQAIKVVEEVRFTDVLAGLYCEAA